MATTHIVETKFTADDQTSGVLTKQAELADRAGESVDRLKNKVREYAGIAAGAVGLFGFAESLRGANEFYDTVRDIANVTGMTASTASGIAEAFERVGIEGQETGRIIESLSRVTAEMSMAASGAVSDGKELQERFSAVGVDISKGPVEALKQMAAGVQQGKINAGELMEVFAIRGEAAADLMRLLKQGPEAIEQIAAKGGPITDALMGNFQQMEQSSYALHAEWNEVMIKLEEGLLPVAKEFLNDLRAWLPAVEGFFSFTTEHLGGILTIAGMIATVWAGVWSVDKIRGFVGAIQGIGGWMGGLMGPGALNTGGAGAAGAEAELATAAEAATTALGGLTAAADADSLGGAVRDAGELATAAEGTTDALAGASGLSTAAGTAAAALAPIAVVGGGAAFALKGWADALADSHKDITQLATDDPLLQAYQAEKAAARQRQQEIDDNRITYAKLHAQEVAAEKAQVDAMVDSSNAAMTAAQTTGIAWDTLTKKGNELMLRVAESYTGLIQSGLSETAAIGQLDMTVPGVQAFLGALADASVKKKATAVHHYDFRGSHFEISQAFTNQDPEAIMASFANDLAGAADRRLQSPFAPVFGAR